MSKFKYYIPFFIASVLFVLMLSSCIVTEKQKERFLAKHCVSKDSIVTITKDSISYKDSIIKIPTIINNPIYLENPCSLLCDSLGRLKPFFRDQKKGGLKSTVSTIGNVLAFDCRTDSLKARIQYLERFIKTNHSSTKTVKEQCNLEHRNKFDGFTYWWFWISISVIALLFGFKLLGGYIRRLLPFKL